MLHDIGFGIQYLGSDAAYALGGYRTLMRNCTSQIDQYHQHAAPMTTSSGNRLWHASTLALDISEIMQRAR